MGYNGPPEGEAFRWYHAALIVFLLASYGSIAFGVVLIVRDIIAAH